MSCTHECHDPTPAQAHCGACHITLANVITFDQHRQNGRCLTPASLDLVEVGRVWAKPAYHAKLGASLERMRRARGEGVGATESGGGGL